MVTSSNPTTIQSAITLAHSPTDDAVRASVLVKKGEQDKKAVELSKKVFEDERKQIITNGSGWVIKESRGR
jgi:inhibitor of KinA sporulation pathway (predicted exonuclease)